MSQVHHRYATVDGRRLFYREAGPADGPVLVLLHGFPTSSYMFRNLIPQLADRYRVIAPDHLGFGLSDAPSVDEFDYTFDALTDLTVGLLDQLGVTRYALYVQDYGAPIGWRMALRNSDAITAIVTQNGNGYDSGFVESFWKTVWDYQREQTPETEDAIRFALTPDATRWQYLTGVPDESLVDPEAWQHDYGLLSRPGNDLIQLALFRDYATNPPLYPALHAYLRASRVPVLAVWGRGDEIFAPEGATAFADDAADAEIHLLDGGHFLLESANDEVAALIRDFLARRLDAPAQIPLSLEVVQLPVSDVDRALAFYTEQVGFTLDVDYQPTADFRVVQLTPPGSATSVQLVPASADRVRDLYLVTPDLAATRAELLARGVAVGDVRRKNPVEDWTGGFADGLDPQRRNYASFADFADPDGNSWTLQERS
ncbi:MAG TPA: alpha/beta fold hydrolase [Jatrophihabitantaceae bacterium]|jgi:pimeloyl-ACP methyl ester carboxylesterase/catechol 2,3-dioxygenase-like lactoylglutathione lyase family enzyme